MELQTTSAASFPSSFSCFLCSTCSSFESCSCNPGSGSGSGFGFKNENKDLLRMLEETVDADADLDENLFVGSEEAVRSMMKSLEMEMETCVSAKTPCASATASSSEDCCASINGCLGHSDSAAFMSTTSSLLSCSSNSDELEYDINIDFCEAEYDINVDSYGAETGALFPAPGFETMQEFVCEDIWVPLDLDFEEQ